MLHNVKAEFRSGADEVRSALGVVLEQMNDLYQEQGNEAAARQVIERVRDELLLEELTLDEYDCLLLIDVAERALSHRHEQIVGVDREALVEFREILVRFVSTPTDA